MTSSSLWAGITTEIGTPKSYRGAAGGVPDVPSCELGLLSHRETEAVPRPIPIVVGVPLKSGTGYYTAAVGGAIGFLQSPARSPAAARRGAPTRQPSEATDELAA